MAGETWGRPTPHPWQKNYTQKIILVRIDDAFDELQVALGSLFHITGENSTLDEIDEHLDAITTLLTRFKENLEDDDGR